MTLNQEIIASQAEYLASEYSTNRGTGDPVVALKEEGIKYIENTFGVNTTSQAKRSIVQIALDGRRRGALPLARERMPR